MIVGKGNKHKNKIKTKPNKNKKADLMAATTTSQVYTPDSLQTGRHSTKQLLINQTNTTTTTPNAHDFNMNNGEENDEENIVIDLPDEEDDDDDDDDDDDNDCDDVDNDDNNNQYQILKHRSSSSNEATSEQTGAIQADSMSAFCAGDLIWFDPNQLGYSIPGKVLDFYPDLTVLTVEGCGQPIALEDSQLEDETRNRLLLKADDTLQVYELSDLTLFKTIKRRQPITNTSGLTDLIDLDEMSLESIIWNLKVRQKQDLIYTQCGEKILFSLNPYKQLFDTYNLDQVNRYDTITTSAIDLSSNHHHHHHHHHNHQLSPSKLNFIKWLMINHQRDESSPSCPHIFRMANEALKALLINQQDQCFVLLGDSGSGKTEACKLLIQYFATVNKSPTNLMTEQILEAIQVLESFGNSRTILNDNSSRFGKLLEIKFNLANGFIMNAKLIDLNLLDRSRIVCQSELERNYHVFYELLSGLNKNEKEKYGLQTADKYFYLNQGHCLELDNKDDGEDFRSLLASMQVLGFNYEEQDTIFRILASILHLGNIYFHRKVLAVRSGKLAAVQAADGGHAGVEGVEIGSDTEVRWVSHLLQIQFELVMRCLTVRTTETSSGKNPTKPANNSDRIVTPLNIDQALDTRDAIARALYTCLFKWLVQRINVMINAQNDGEPNNSQSDQQNQNQDHQQYATSNNSTLINKEPIYLCRTSESLCEFQPDKLRSSARDSHSNYRPSSFRNHLNPKQQQQQLQAATISILDAFGFENLAENNFEQLCVNYASELLNYHTHRYLVRLEQAEYTRERLRWQPIESLSNLLNNNHHLNGSTHNNGNSFTTIGSSNSNNTSTTNTSHGNQKSSSIVNLISKKPLGILALLDDECNFPKATDQSFAEKCHHNHALNENYQCARLAANCQEFGIRHFRHTNRMVWYQVDGFIEKNRDSLRPDVVELLVGSKMTIVADMLRKIHKTSAIVDSTGNVISQTGPSSKGGQKTISRTFDGRYVSMKPRQATVAARFQDTLHNNRVMESLNCSTSCGVASASSVSSNNLDNNNYASRTELMSITNDSKRCIQQPNSWFIVCLKPNRSKTANVFDVAFVQEQVKSMGLFDLLQMRKFGFPVRIRYGEFVRRYKCLVPSKFLNNLSSCQDIQAASRRIQQEKQQHHHNSPSKNHHQQQIIKKAIRDVCSSIIEFKLQQSHTSNNLSELSSLKAQYQCGLTRMFLNERLFHLLESWRLTVHFNAIRLIQKTFRMWLVRREFQSKRRACIVIQREVRAFQARRLFGRQYWLLVNLQRKWRQHLVAKRSRQHEARRKALKEQQQQQLQELLQSQQRNKHSNQFRFRMHPAHSQPVSAKDNNNSNYGRGLLDIPEDLAQLYRLQRQWQPIHDMSNLNEVNLVDLLAREQKRQIRFQPDCSSVPFVVTMASDGGDNGGQTGEKLAQFIDKLELDEQYSLQKFLLKYYPLEEAPQFGYSRLPITRPFTWTQLMKRRRSLLDKRLKLFACPNKDQPESAANLHSGGYEQSIRHRFVDIEQKSIAIYKLILRFIDSEQSLSDLENDELNLSERQKHELLLQKVIKFKLISDYINYLCLTEPLLRDEVFLQLASQCWQNSKIKSTENAWKLMLNCLNSFEPLDCNLIKYLIKYCNDYCCDKYRQLISVKLYEALGRRRSQSGGKSVYQVVSGQRRYPTTIMEYWANQQAIGRLALSASCYMDDHSLIGPPANVMNQQHSQSIAGDDDYDGLEHSSNPNGNLDDLNTINYSNKTLVQMDSHTTAEALASQVLRARSIPEANLVGWSVEIQHEGALSEFSSRLRGDDYLLDHFARLELLPELVQLIDDDLETFECEQLDELNLVVADQPIAGLHHAALEPCCVQANDVNSSEDLSRNQGQPFNRFSSSGSQRSWSAANDLLTHQSHNSHYMHPQLQLQLQQQRATTTTPAGNQFSHHYRHSAAFSEFDLATSHRSSMVSNHQSYRPYQQAYGPPADQFGVAYRHHETSAMSANRRSMSMQELQLAASSALNGRYFMMNNNNNHHHHGVLSNSPSAHYASSYVSSSQTPDCCRTSARPHTGSLRRQSNEPPSGATISNASSHYKRRSATPNSLAPGNLSRNGRRLSSSAYGSQNGSSTGKQQVRPGRAPERRDPRGPAPRRSASSSSRTPAMVQSALGDYAATQSDYERIGYGRSQQQQRQQHQHHYQRRTGANSACSQPINPSKRPAGSQAQKKRAQHQQRVNLLRKAPIPVDQQDQQRQRQHHQIPADNQTALYAATSSAMSDTSEAPSMASHVRKVKVPQSNGDLDRYLDDLFNPLLDEADLDELSDARSMAASIRGTNKTIDERDQNLMRRLADPSELSKLIRGTTLDDDDDDDGELEQHQQVRQEQLSPTFESLLKSLKTSTSGVELAGGGRASNLDNMNLSELKALNERLEGQIQAAQSARPSLVEMIGSSSSSQAIEASESVLGPPPPPPPPLPSFKAGGGGPSQVDDVYSRAKTIRIGKWRWPPAREQVATSSVDDVHQTDGQREMILPTGERKRASVLEMSLAGPEELPAVKLQGGGGGGVGSDEQLATKTMEQQQQQQQVGFVANESATSANVGRLKISSMMKAKLEQLTNGNNNNSLANSTANTTRSQQPEPGQSSPTGAMSTKPPKRLAEQRKNLLEHQLLGNKLATQSSSESPSRPTSDTPSVSKVQAAKQQLAAAAGLALAALDNPSAASSQASSRRQSGVQPVAANQGAGIAAGEGAHFQRSSRQLQMDELGPQSRSAISQRQAFYRISASSDRLDQLMEGAGKHGEASCQLEPRRTNSSSETPADEGSVAAKVALGGAADAAANQLRQSKLTRATPMASDLNEAGQSPVGSSSSSSSTDKPSQRSLAIERLCGKSIGGSKCLSSRKEPAPPTPISPAGPTNSASSSCADHQWVSSCSPVEPTLLGKPNSSVTNNVLVKANQSTQQKAIGTPATTDVRQPMTTLTHANVDWQVRIRKEVFKPSECYDDPLVIQLIFAQLVADVFNPRHWTRLNNKERAAIKAVMKDNSIGYAPSLPRIGEMQSIKRDLVRMARSFGLYFTRSYQALNFSCLLDELHESILYENFNGSEGEEDQGDDDGRHSSGDSDESSSVGSVDRGAGGRRRRPSVRVAIRLAIQMRNANKLGSEWLDMVAVHHSGLRLVALVTDQQQQQHQQQQPQMNPQATPPANPLLASGPPTPPVGYKVLETLKFRDMTDVTLISERVLLVSMHRQCRHKCWLISSQQANQLASLLKTFLIDYNQQVRPSASTAAPANHYSKDTHNLAKQQAEANTKTSQQHNNQQKNNALLASNDDHHGDHLEQRQTSNRLEQLHPAPHTDNVLAHSGRVLPDNLPAIDPKVDPIEQQHSASKRPPAQRAPRRQPAAHPSRPSIAPPPASTATPASPASPPPPPRPATPPDPSPPLGGGGGGSGGRPDHQPGGGRGASKLDEPHGGGRAHDSGGHGGQSNATPTPPANQPKKGPGSGGQLQVGGPGGSQTPKRASKWQSSLSKMSNKFNIFASSTLNKRQQQGPKDTHMASQRESSASINNSQDHDDDDNNNNNNNQQVQFDAWIETQVDFDEDESADDEQEQQINNNRVKSFEEHKKEPPPTTTSSSTTTTTTTDTSNNNNVDQQQQKDDGKHSMLQFALYNFREAIEKYSLESRLSKFNQNLVNQPPEVSSQRNQLQQMEVGDTSTLRGSLKLIESLRSGPTNGGASNGQSSRQQHQAGQQQTTKGAGTASNKSNNDWTWRELAEMVKFTQQPIKRSLLKLGNDDLDRRATDCFAAIMQYMGDLASASSAGSSAGSKAAIPGGEVECVYLILINCHNYLKLRDEVYCQLIKQTTNNRSPRQDSCLRGWRLFSIVAAYFDCSPNFKPYLLKYLEQAAYDKRRAYHSIASVCLQNLRKTFKYRGRKNVPSIEEIAATSAGRNSKRQIYRLPGGTERVINTKSTTVVDDIIHEICSNMLNVNNTDEMLEYSLYCIADGDLFTMPLNRDEYILDITTELIKNHQQYFLIFCRSIWHYPLRLDSKLYIEVIFNQIAPDYLEGLLLVLPSSSSSSCAASLASGSHDDHGSTLTSNSSGHRTSSRPPASGRSSVTNLSPQGHHYYQQRGAAPAANKPPRGPLRLRRTMVKEIARIAALLHRASGTDYIPHKDEIKFLLPKPIVSAIKHQQRHQSQSQSQPQQDPHQQSSASSVSSGSQTRLLIGQSNQMHQASEEEEQEQQQQQQNTVITPSPQKWVELVQEQCRQMSAFEALDAKAQFLDIVRHWPLFGSSFFAIKLIQRDLIQPMEFILALNKLGIQMLDIHTHETIHKYQFNEVVSTRKVRSEDGALFLDMKCGNLMKRTIIRIQTDQAHEISRLIRQYIDIELLQTNKQTAPST